MPEKWVLRQMQALPLEAKVTMTKTRIIAWYEHFDGNVCISFSGGKDSTVLAHLVHSIYPEVPLVFANTGLEYPEIQAFAKKMGAEFVRPKMSFSEVISTYGYPIISKENAEAIYYARRIKNGGDQRETDRRRKDLKTTEWGRAGIGADPNKRYGTYTKKINGGGTENYQYKANETNYSETERSTRRDLLMGGNGKKKKEEPG